MALSTYSDLKAAISDWLVGHSLEGQIDTFIDMAEAEFNRTLRLREMQRRSVATLDQQYVSLPGDFLEAVNVTLSSDPDVSLRPITMDAADYHRERLRGGQPRFFCISGAQMEIVPAPSDQPEVEMVYYAVIPALDDDNPTNWLLDKAPDLYLNAALAAAAPYIADPQRGAFWRAEAQRIAEELRLASWGARFGASPIIARPRTVF